LETLEQDTTKQKWIL